MVMQLWGDCNMYPCKPFAVHMHLEKTLKVYRKEKLCIFKPIIPNLFLSIPKFFSCIIIEIEPNNRVSEYYQVLSGPVDIEDYALWEYKCLSRQDYNEHVTVGA